MSRPMALACAASGAIIALTATFLSVSISLVAFGGVLLVMGLAASDATAGQSYLNHPVLVRLGAWSYGVFILHVPVYMSVKAMSDLVGYGLVVNLVTTIIMACLVVFVAAIAHHVIEEPARKWLRAWQPLAFARARAL